MWSGRANGADLLSGEAPNGNSCFYCCCKMNLLVLCCCCCCSEGSTLMANYPTSYTIIASSCQFSGNSTSTDHPKWFIQGIFLLSFCYYCSFVIVLLEFSPYMKSTSKLHASISSKQFLGVKFSIWINKMHTIASKLTTRSTHICKFNTWMVKCWIPCCYTCNIRPAVRLWNCNRPTTPC